MSNRIREWREKRELSLDDLADSIGISTGYLSRMETGGRNVSLKYLPKLASALGVKETDLVNSRGARTVPLMGYAAAGGDSVVYYSDAQGPFDEVEAPEGATQHTVAVQVRGTSLGRLFDGWIAFYDDVRDPPEGALLNRVCVCGLADGRVMIKKLRPGSAKGLYHLESETEPTMFDVPVDWAAKVREFRQV